MTVNVAVPSLCATVAEAGLIEPPVPAEAVIAYVIRVKVATTAVSTVTLATVATPPTTGSVLPFAVTETSW